MIEIREEASEDFGLDNEYNELDSFMVLAFKEGILPAIRGVVRYAPEFDIAGC